MERQVVVVTGASAGVGRATAVRFAREGAAVALLARGEAGLEAAAEDVIAAGGIALALPVDVADAEAVDDAAYAVERELGPIDVWVNNAMVSVFAPIVETDPEEFRRVTDVTFHGYVWGTMAALRRMRPRNRGAVCQVGSALAYRAIPLQAAYCAAKHAIRAFSDSLRAELLHEGSAITISMVQLPAVNTPQFEWSAAKMPRRPQPVAPIYQPEIAAEAIWFAATHQRRELWVGGRNTAAILAAKALPGALDHLLGRTGFDSQQSAEPLDEGHRSNLFEPLDDDRDAGIHGRFDSDARTSSFQLELARRRPFPGALARPIGAILARFA